MKAFNILVAEKWVENRLGRYLAKYLSFNKEPEITTEVKETNRE